MSAARHHSPTLATVVMYHFVQPAGAGPVAGLKTLDLSTFRAQLAPIRPYAGVPTGELTTVLYAPTWEGWDGNPGNTSVILAGENIVRGLLADDKVRPWVTSRRVEKIVVVPNRLVNIVTRA